MSKSILVIDTPDNCKNCLFCKKYQRIHNLWAGNITTYNPNCLLMDNDFFQEIPTEQKPDWCPLKDVPIKKKENKYHNSYQKGQTDGWNMCINEILKGDGAE